MKMSGPLTFRPLHLLITWGAFSILPAIFAANGPPPVTLNQPVTIQGLVEVLNATLNKPYAKRVANLSSQSVLTLSFNVPDGKRLIVETITFEAFHPETDVVRFLFRMSDSDDPASIIEGPLAVQNKFPTASSAVVSSVGTHPIKLRVDGRPGSNQELSFTMIRAQLGVSASFGVTVHGYLVDLPASP